LYILEKKNNNVGNKTKIGIKISKLIDGSEMSLKIEGV
jgi:hypothetical protein